MKQWLNEQLFDGVLKIKTRIVLKYFFKKRDTQFSLEIYLCEINIIKVYLSRIYDVATCDTSHTGLKYKYKLKDSFIISHLLTKAKGHNWIDIKQRATTLTMTVHIASLSRGNKLIRSVNAITSKPGTQDPIVPNAKTRDVPASPSLSRVPGPRF